MRLDKEEKDALRYGLDGVKGDVYLFGSRMDEAKRGGDIDILLVPRSRVNALKLSLKIQARFFSKCEERIDVMVYRDNLIHKEILKNARRLDI